jgi:neutral ceramidase
MNEQGQWEVYACDGDWETKFYWKRQGYVVSPRMSAMSALTCSFFCSQQRRAQSSLITLEWDVPTWTPPGTYRLHYYGDAKSVTQQITPIEGVSSPFQIVA